MSYDVDYQILESTEILNSEELIYIKASMPRYFYIICYPMYKKSCSFYMLNHYVKYEGYQTFSIILKNLCMKLRDQFL